MSISRELKCEDKESRQQMTFRFESNQPVATGAFSQIFRGTMVNHSTGRTVLAVLKKEFDGLAYPVIELEGKVYAKLNRLKSRFFPKCHGRMVDVDGRKCLLVDRLGPSLLDKMKSVPKDKRLAWGIQMIDCIEELHTRGKFVHRDVKPENFCFRLDDVNLDGPVVLLDFGLSKPLDCLEYKTGKKMTGTPRYCSLNTHRGLEQNKRDDIESLAYSVALMLNDGPLPWSNIPGCRTVDEKREAIGRAKESADISLVCPGFKGVQELIRYARALEFNATPDYARCRQLLRADMTTPPKSTKRLAETTDAATEKKPRMDE